IRLISESERESMFFPQALPVELVEKKSNVKPAPAETEEIGIQRISLEEAGQLLTYGQIEAVDEGLDTLAFNAATFMRSAVYRPEGLREMLNDIPRARRQALLYRKEFIEQFETYLTLMALTSGLRIVRHFCVDLFGNEADLYLEQFFKDLIFSSALDRNHRLDSFVKDYWESYPQRDSDIVKLPGLRDKVKSVIENPKEDKLWAPLFKGEFKRLEILFIVRMLIQEEQIAIAQGKYTEAAIFRINLENLFVAHHRAAISDYQSNYAHFLKVKPEMQALPGKETVTFAMLPKREKERIARRWDEYNRWSRETFAPICRTLNKYTDVDNDLNSDWVSSVSLIAREKGMDEILAYLQEAKRIYPRNMHWALYHKLLSGSEELTDAELEFLYHADNVNILKNTISILILAGQKERLNSLLTQYYVNASHYLDAVFMTFTILFKGESEEALSRVAQQFEFSHKILIDAYLVYAHRLKEDKNPLIAVRARRMLDSQQDNNFQQPTAEEPVYLIPTREQISAEDLMPSLENVSEEIDSSLLDIVIYPSTGVMMANPDNDIFVTGSIPVASKFAITVASAFRDKPTRYKPSSFLENLSQLPDQFKICKVSSLNVTSYDHMPLPQYLAAEIIKFQAREIIANEKAIEEFPDYVSGVDIPASKVNLVDTISAILFCKKLLLFLNRKYNLGMELDISKTNDEVEYLLKKLPPIQEWHPDTRAYFEYLSQ
ncbi:MAG: hypothetical protein KBC84_10910, partial [Proteobacteria bacterium]|nr:hypothetical protein [Pseudomonadota bacterium]